MKLLLSLAVGSVLLTGQAFGAPDVAPRRYPFIKVATGRAPADATQTITETVSGNFPVDLYGQPDTRMAGQSCHVGPCIWGTADAAVLPIKFNAPQGYRVRIVSLRGDIVSWIKSLPGEPPTPLESTAGVLGGFQLDVEGSKHCDYCADSCPLYVQDAVTERQPKARTPFMYEDVGLLLGPDNILLAKVASWLNTTTKPIHIEITYTIRFRYEKDETDN